MRKFIAESWLIVLLGAVFAVLLAGAQTSLQPTIRVNQQKALNEAVGMVVPGTVKTEKLAVSGYDREVFRCLDGDGKLIGWAIDAAGMGFADKIRAVIGLSADAETITGLKVIENVETPGLGNKVAAEPTSESDRVWADQYKGLSAAIETTVVKRAPIQGKNEVQAVTGATISSKAVVDLANKAVQRVRPELRKQDSPTRAENR
ncbi:MAG: FMN-binding protein [Phycisphaerae bacterium]